MDSTNMLCQTSSPSDSDHQPEEWILNPNLAIKPLYLSLTMQNLPSKPSNLFTFSAAVTQTELVTFKDCVCRSPESQDRVTGAHRVSFSPYISAGSTQQYLHTRHALLEVSSWRLPKHTMTNFFWKCITFQGRLHTLPSRGNNLELSLVKNQHPVGFTEQP